MNTCGDLRRELANCFLLAKEGKLTGDALRGVVGTAKEINISMAYEIKAREALKRAGEAAPAMGDFPLFPVSANAEQK